MAESENLPDEEVARKRTVRQSCKSYWTSFNSVYQAIILAVVVVVYLLIGAAILTALEAPAEEAQIRSTVAERKRLREMIMMRFNATEDEVNALFNNFSTACANDLLVANTVRIWTYARAVFFSATVVTTIGYGNISPSTSGGQSFCVIYALFGIPLAVALLAVLGQLMNQLFQLILKHFHGKKQWILWAVTGIVLIAGYVLFVAFPAIIFMAIEGWTYREATYYSFITLSTIGFGDFVAGQQEDIPENNVLRDVYKLCVAAWVFIGLAFLAIIITELGTLMTKLWSRMKLRCVRFRKRRLVQKAEELSTAGSEKGLHGQEEGKTGEREDLKQKEVQGEADADEERTNL